MCCVLFDDVPPNTECRNEKAVGRFIWELKKTDPINSLFKALFDNKGLVRKGFFYTKLQPIINRHISEIVTAKAHENLEDDDILNSIKDYIDNENPIMISVQYSGGAHAMLAVGYEATDDGIVNIFCLDPAYDCSPTSYWNAVIALNENQSKKYPHKWITNNPINFLSRDSSNSRNVWLGEILCIDKK